MRGPVAQSHRLTVTLFIMVDIFLRTEATHLKPELLSLLQFKHPTKGSIASVIQTYYTEALVSFPLSMS
jgi:hypothetical protein